MLAHGDFVFFAAQPDDAPIQEYDWVIDKGEYIRLLRDHEVTRDPALLAAFIQVDTRDRVFTYGRRARQAPSRVDGALA